MNKQFMSSVRQARQAGFTLIELIVVIVILGILAATALPRFASLGGEARLASLNAAKGALSATSAMTHGKWLVTREATMTVEGTPVAMHAVSGYPSAVDGTAATNLATASGLTAADYTIIGPGSAATTTAPGTGANQLVIVPNSVAGTATALTCFVRFTAPTVANGVPAIVVGNPARTNAERVADCE